MRFAKFAWLFSLVFVVSLTFAQEAKKEHDEGPKDITETNPKAAAKLEAVFVSGVRQLTFEGRRAGEGYFSKDGSMMVFQSERIAENPFFQIYLMDLDTGDMENISPGHGKTTCAWIHPTGERVLFASTHGDPEAKAKQVAELKLRSDGKERRYSWDYDEHFELYQFDRASKKYVNLTNARGYDAEGYWSPDGKWIAFASNRLAYTKKLTEREQEMFKLDKAYMMDIYIMKADGSQLKRLTTSPGYDGGPFFSPDGKRICWRRFSENGATAEIMTMNVDGSDQRQLTNLGVMSWAPYYHPTGKYLIFTTNRHGFANFELYLIDAEGKSKPVRVTHTKGFDGLPVFTPDGKQLAWTTNRTSSKRSQIFMSKWDHAKALKALKLNEGELADTSEAEKRASASSKLTSAQFRAEDALRHVDYLCHPNLGGRLTGTRGEKLATAYVAAYLDSLGIKPAGDDGWFQPFEFTSGVALGAKNGLTAAGQVLTIDKQWRPVAFSQLGKIKEAEVAFAGYGIVAPKTDEQEEYDSYVHLDVKDKWVLAFRFLPPDVSAERRQHLMRFSDPRHKAMVARDRGAKGLILVSGPMSKVNSQLIPLRFDGSLSGTSLPVISVTDSVAKEWLQKSDKSLAELQQKLSHGGLMVGFPLKGVKVAGSIDIKHVKKMGRNVLGRLQAGTLPSHDAIVIGAHIDHLGIGANGSSLARSDERNGIHYGADDNASGIAAMLEVAEYMATLKKAGKFPMKRDVIFAAWSGEELGLLGSAHFCKELHQEIQAINELITGQKKAKAKEAKSDGKDTKGTKGSGGVVDSPKKDGAKKDGAKKDGAKKDGAKKDGAKKADPKSANNPHANPHANPHGHGAFNPNSIYPYISACLNMDMVGRLNKKLVLQGVGSSSIWKSEIERRNAPIGLPITLQNDSYLPTDASSFFMRGVPILSAFTGSHEDYHTPRDTPDKLNYEGLVKTARFMALVGRSLAIRENAPDYIPQAAPEGGQRKARLRAYLGTVPDYAEGDVKGVLLSGVAKNGPADKAGVRSGDIIVKLAGKKIENIYDYTYAIEALKIGKKVKITVRRKGKNIEMTLTPGSRD